MNDRAKYRMNDRAMYRMNDRMNDRAKYRMNDRAMYRMNDRTNDRAMYRTNDRTNDRVKYRMNDRMESGTNDRMNETASLRCLHRVIALAAACCLTSLAHAATAPEEHRRHDDQVYVPVVEAGFDALPGAAPTDRWTGIHEGAAWRIEVPHDHWNGKLVMWAHGYAGTGPKLEVTTPLMRRSLIARGYAWAASSYARNGYDVRDGIESTNALALQFAALAAQHGRALPAPTAVYIAGISMGGHIAAAAVERETIATARHTVRYAGALPMCGVVGDTALFDYFKAYQLAALQLAGLPARTLPIQDWKALAPIVQARLWDAFPTEPSDQGERLKRLTMNLSGGDRPFFDEGYADPALQADIWHTLAADDGTAGGILTASPVDTRGIVYRFDDAEMATPAVEQRFNADIARAVPVADANRLRRDGLRWVPRVQGDFDVPVLTLHTLGDIYVPFRMEQIYRERAEAHALAPAVAAASASATGATRLHAAQVNGPTNQPLLVQRAIRDVGHCAFTSAEAAEAFQALTDWVESGRRPEGDDVSDPATVASPDYGCRYTRNQPDVTDYTPPAQRAALQSHYPPCPGQ